MSTIRKTGKIRMLVVSPEDLRAILGRKPWNCRARPGVLLYSCRVKPECETRGSRSSVERRDRKAYWPSLISPSRSSWSDMVLSNASEITGLREIGL